MESHDEERVAYNASVNGIGEIRTELEVRMKDVELPQPFYL